jgi:agmatine deiminase
MLRFPAEWEPHAATWIAWPHHEPDWPGKFEPIPWVYAEIVRVLAQSEQVKILCHDESVLEDAEACLAAHHVTDRVRFHVVPNDRVWLRDSAPTGVLNDAGELEWCDWGFNAWAKYDNFACDEMIGEFVSAETQRPRNVPLRPDGAGPVVLEGGGIETDGLGTVLVTEEWLLSGIQDRNPGLGRADYEKVFASALGCTRTVWLGEGCMGDDTHGHVDDVARFVAPGVVVVALEEDPADDNHARSFDNVHRLRMSRDARGEALRVITLPFPRAVLMEGQRLPASYANFYIANETVLVPTFNDPQDRIALNTLAELMPSRHVVGIHAVDLVWGLGTLHCLSQQQPAARNAHEGVNRSPGARRQERRMRSGGFAQPPTV